VRAEVAQERLDRRPIENTVRARNRNTGFLGARASEGRDASVAANFVKSGGKLAT
jgi:hypothetical protein